MIRCIAIDDEPLAVNLLKNYAAKTGFLQLVAGFTDALEAKSFLSKEKVDLMFLDIQMPDINGIVFYQSLPEKPMVVFTTAFSDYAVEGFNLNAADYLLKPFEFQRFLQAANKAKEYYEWSSNQEAQPSAIFVKTDYQLVKINLKDILLIEGLDDYIRIHLAANKNILTLMSLKAIAEKLPTADFVRIHRSYIVPLNRIEKISSRKIEIAGKVLPVGNSYAKAFFIAMDRRTNC